jgi:hypothetical protein
VIPTVDPDIFIEHEESDLVIYQATDGRRWEIRGTWDYRGDCNTIALSPVSSDTSDKFMFGFLQDWAGVLFNAASNNRGALNLYWNAVPEPSGRFGWNGTISRLSDFNATPGEHRGTHLTLAQLDAAIIAVGIPLNQQPH